MYASFELSCCEPHLSLRHLGCEGKAVILYSEDEGQDRNAIAAVGRGEALMSATLPFPSR